ncbi:alpha/beta hydrolase [Arthrobacter roseus]|uniref:alpha/beta hydrolase n=1 Tax=Arthrobacter roseus TaxID=136274 RepID=UPI00196282C1|nr:alpha/beta fold hydrolase [Arthrobacter roseus]MBM7848315.1 carboxylesterase [Arthrobacter roseus]
MATSSSAAFSSSGHGERGRIGVVLCHGFTGSPVSVLEWARYLSHLGFAVRVPLLPGHGTTWQELAATPWRAWYEEVERSYIDLRGETDVQIAAGLSMGGALALRLTACEDVAGAAVVNPGLTIEDPRARFSGLMKYLVKSVPSIGNSIKKEGVDEQAYPRTPVAAVHQLGKLFRDTTALLPRITVPVLAFRSTVDPVVAESSMDALRAGISSELLEIVSLTNSYHVATMDHEAETIFSGTADFITRLGGGRGGGA